ncbi:High-copy suppressor of rspA [Serratia odorifera]|uniref:High-copy suppressor of rspA n=1 Tax=Serratia odorifera TaxID=618 RepID=A0A3S4DRQ2_SEROD|nr:High-copy suppressor of rspA [Serratia odorifera]
MAQALGVSAAATVWVANGYLLSAAMTLAIFAALASRIGFRSLFLFGLGVFTLASLGCALSSSLEMLIAMRLLQGVGGAATLSIAPAILRSIFPNRLLGRILGINALLIASITAIAPIVGGTLLSALSWQWLFALNLPLGMAALTLAWRAIPGTATSREPFDVAGALLSAASLGALIMLANSFSDAAAFSANSLLSALAYALVASIAGGGLYPPSAPGAQAAVATDDIRLDTLFISRINLVGVVCQPGYYLRGPAVFISAGLRL